MSLTDPTLAGPDAVLQGHQTWYDEERADWEPPEQINPAEWAERYRELSRRQSSRPGPWRNANQPAAVGLMVLAAHAGVRELWIKKSTQFGASEALRNVIGFYAHLDPSPILLVLPDEQSGRKVVRLRILPLFEDTPVLAALLTGDTADKKLTAISLSNGFDLSLGWAGSPASIATHPQRIVILDEVDKFPAAAMQADPVAESRVRTQTYGDRSHLWALSSPSVPTGPIAKGYEDSPIKVAYYCPCPHCGATFQPRFASIRWEKYPELVTPAEKAGRIEARGAAWMECDACIAALAEGESLPVERRILELHRRDMLGAGWWATGDQGWRIYADGREEGIKPEGIRVGMHIHGQIDLSVPLAKIAAQFVAANGRPDLLKDWLNTIQGEEFRDATATTTPNQFRDKCKPDPERGFTPEPDKIVPAWASRLVMTIDSQKDYFWYVIRAWGHGLRSQRIHHGRAKSFEELEDLYYNAWWHYTNDLFPPRRCRNDAPLAIDSGGGFSGEYADASITDRVYSWCLKDPLWRIPIKGASKSFEEHIRWKDVTYTPPGQGRSPYNVRLHFLDPIFWRDLLASYIGGRVPIIDPGTGEVGEVDQWELNARNDEEYNAHLAAVHKVRKKRGRAFVEVWEPKPGSPRHDYHDLESYQIAWALGPAKCQMLPSPAQMAAMVEAAKQAATAAPAGPGGLKTRDGRPFLAIHRKP
jgi:phage terminase large subunit GpA-like protein